MDPPPPDGPSGPPPSPPPGVPSWPPQGRASRGWVWLVVLLLVVAVLPVVVGLGAAVSTKSQSTVSPVSFPPAGTPFTPTGTPPPPFPPSPAPVFTDPTSHFSATFRDPPLENDSSLTLGGRSIPLVQWSDLITQNVAETVGYATYPASFRLPGANAALDGAVAGQVSNVGGTLSSKTFGRYQGFRSVDALIAVQHGFVESRTILVGRTLYILLATSTYNPPELFAGFAPTLTIMTHA